MKTIIKGAQLEINGLKPHDSRTVSLEVEWDLELRKRKSDFIYEFQFIGATLLIKTEEPTGAFTGNGYDDPIEEVLEAKTEIIKITPLWNIEVWYEQTLGAMREMYIREAAVDCNDNSLMLIV